MNRREAERALLLYRPGTPDVRDPEIAEALELARQDPELRRRHEQHCAFQTAVREKLRQIEAPADLKARLLAPRKVVSLPVWWRSPLWITAVAAMGLLFLGLVALWNKPRTPDQFADFQTRMIRAVLREYAMDLKTNDMQQVREFLASRGAPADYVVSPGLEQLKLTGGGALRWRSNPVSMVCFDRGGNQMLYLFVMSSAAVKDPPPPTPRVAEIKQVQVATWTREGKSYLLAGPKDSALQKYL
jgi:hypothetical protein